MKLSFICNGDSCTGFGHVARCLHLARLGRGAFSSVQISFQGKYSDVAARRIREAVPQSELRGEDEVAETDVAVFDRLGNPDDLNSHAEALIDKVAGHAARLIYLASGTDAPRLPRNAQCVGYQPGGPESDPPRVLWGWDYAPVAPEFLVHRGAARDPARVLVALGGHRDDTPLQLVITALARLEAVRQIDVLLSPVVDVGELPAAAHQSLHRYSNVPSVGPMIARASLVIASFGNLTYEALALGTPICLVAQKAFQHDLASAMAMLGLVVNAGLAQDLDAENLASAIARARALTGLLSQRGPATVDGHGLERIAKLITQAGVGGHA